ncbi:TrkH family potassium uptake protein [Aurantimonas sp. VKM B-3413]|uniref:TrkH family potassium uptake protein n=1 Tax=Aurantimonas sp. VKM B-3413 TaxID=2779401 RepID=UPI001E4197EC|nr:TrkH family potassium uptake protein [Aurantimonas sp. VKM B-3413]MCB8837313.1 TrkH family potassium uptake protein [Aurantimonas sp. VKM B-3413]
MSSPVSTYFRSHAQFAIFVNGLLLIGLGASMLVPALVDFGTNNRDAENFVICALLVGGTGSLFAAAFRQHRTGTLDRRTGYLITLTAWLSVSFFGSLPLAVSSLNISMTDALFETVSGLTTTGATVLSGLDTTAPGLLLWRSLLQWIGGIGIVVMALAMLPLLHVGGMQLFLSESSDVSGKTFPRVGQFARAIGAVYVGLTLACTAGLMVAGMGAFDAVNHAMAAIATGGFSTKDASVGFYNSVGIEVVLIVFMTAGALPLVVYASLLMRGRRAILEDGQVFGFLKVLAVAIGAATVWNISQGMEPFLALRVSAFNVTSVLTDTGFATTDFSTWGSFAIGLFFVLYFIGGCAGSTAGAIKIFRWQILFVSALRHLKTTLSPSRILVLRYQQKQIDGDTIAAVRNFFFMYLITFVVLSLAAMATGLDFLSSTSAVAQGMANAGPGLGPVVGPATNFGHVPEAAKWVVMAAMLLGRLELATVYVVLLPDFWKR